MLFGIRVSVLRLEFKAKVLVKAEGLHGHKNNLKTIMIFNV